MNPFDKNDIAQDLFGTVPTAALNGESTGWPQSIDEALAAVKEMQDKFAITEREILRKESQMIEKMKCPKCGRKPTVVNRGQGVTYVVCGHTMHAIKNQIPATDSIGRPTLGAVIIEVFEDGPQRF